MRWQCIRTSLSCAYACKSSVVCLIGEQCCDFSLLHWCACGYLRFWPPRGGSASIRSQLCFIHLARRAHHISLVLSGAIGVFSLALSGFVLGALCSCHYGVRAQALHAHHFEGMADEGREGRRGACGCHVTDFGTASNHGRPKFSYPEAHQLGPAREP